MTAPTLTPPVDGEAAPSRRGRRSAQPPAVASRLALPPTRRRPGRVAAGAAVLAVGAAVGALAAGQSNSSTAVLVVARQVPLGTALTRDDLSVARLKADPALSLIRASEVDQVLGKVTSVPLAAGTTLSMSELGGTDAPAAGHQVVGLALRPGLLPARRLVPGGNVVLVPAPDASGASAARSQPVTPATAAGGATTAATPAVGSLAASTPAVVTDVGAPDTSGTVVVDVEVPDTVAGAVAAEGAAGRVALTLAPAGSR